MWPKFGLASPWGRGLFRHLVRGQMFEDADQAGMVPTLAAERGGGVEQLLRHCRVGQREAESARTLEGEAQILLMQFDAEARLESALDHALAMDLEDPR